MTPCTVMESRRPFISTRPADTALHLAPDGELLMDGPTSCSTGFRQWIEITGKYEKASIKQSVNMQAISGETAVAYKERLRKLIKTPYFGRIDFKETGRKQPDPIYVGMHSFFDEDENENLIHDWRAPVSGSATTPIPIFP